MKKPSIQHAILLSCLLAFGKCEECRGQSFQNLNFEDGDPSSAAWNSTSGCYWLSTAYGLPYWHTYYELGEQTRVVYNSCWLDGSSVGLYDSTAVAVAGGYQFGPQYPLAGTFSAYLHAEWWPWGHFDAGIGQTGVIPAGARSVQFLSSAGPIFNYQAGLPSGMWAFSVQLNGVSTPCYQLSEQPGYIQWGADVSGMAGTLTDLRLTLTTGLVALPRPGPPDTEGVIIGIDEISFSPTIVPEPSALCLAVLGAAMLAVLQGSRKG